MARKDHWTVDEKQQCVCLSDFQGDPVSVLPAARVFTRRSSRALAAKLASLGYNANASHVSGRHYHPGHQFGDPVYEVRDTRLSCDNLVYIICPRNGKNAPQERCEQRY